MKELFSLWGNARFVVLVALTAALYASVLIPFKVAVPFIPGFTELRPANAIPPVCSLLFGPPAAWGSAFGNLIADFFGTLGPGTFFGFIGNFLYGFIPYALWGKKDFSLNSGLEIVKFSFCAVVSSSACALTIAWGLHTLQLVPFKVLFTAIFLNNVLFSLMLSLPLLRTLNPIVKKWGFHHTQIFPESKAGRWRKMGVLLMVLGTFAGTAEALFLINALTLKPLIFSFLVSPFVLLLLLSLLFF